MAVRGVISLDRYKNNGLSVVDLNSCFSYSESEIFFAIFGFYDYYFGMKIFQRVALIAFICIPEPVKQKRKCCYIKK
jgi:hypothetical protein